MAAPNDLLELNQSWAEVTRVEGCTGVAFENWHTAFGPEGVSTIFGLITGRLDAVEFVVLMQATMPHLDTSVLRCLLDAFIIGA